MKEFLISKHKPTKDNRIFRNKKAACAFLLEIIE